MDKRNYDALRLENQLCFPLYASSREIIKRYKPCLDELDLTYTQYITMLVMWERKQVNVKELGECLYLDSGTLTPLLKKMEQKGLVTRARSEKDERNLIVTVTPAGEELRERALQVPDRMNGGNPLTQEETTQLYNLLYKLLTTKVEE